jgi:carbon monoxide dehydrogenase subunit G
MRGVVLHYQVPGEPVRTALAKDVGMKVALDKIFPLAATAESAWQLLQDIETVAGCMPGAKITERIDETHYKGTITVRLGPATMAFKGEIEVLNLDSAARSLHMVGKGSDSTGTSAASMDLTAAVQATGDTCELAGKSEVTMSGKAASLGGRLMGPVADQMLKQFVANFAARLQARQANTAGEEAQAAVAVSAAPVGTAASASSVGDASASSAASADTATGMPGAALGGVPTVTATAATAAATGAAKASVGPAPPPEPAAPPAELNGLAMAWAILRDWLRGLFSRKTV